MTWFRRCRRFIYTFDPALFLADTFWRELLCMLCIFFGPYLIGPYLGLPPRLAIGASGGLMSVTQNLAGARTRRALFFQTLSGMLGVLLGGGLMFAAYITGPLQIPLQILLLTFVICLNFKWKTLHKNYGLAAVQTMLGASLMFLIVERVIPKMGGFILTYFLLTAIIFTVICLLMAVIIRYPSQVLVDAKISLCCAHEYTAERAYQLLNKPTRWRKKLLEIAVLQNHRCAVAAEAAMVGLVRFPAPLGEAIHRSAFDLDLLLLRLARIAQRASELPAAQTEFLRPQLAEMMALAGKREGAALRKLWQLAEDFREVFPAQQQQSAHPLAEYDFLLFIRVPHLIKDLVREIEDGRLAHAQADAWINQNYHLLRQAQREQDNAWFWHPWLKLMAWFGPTTANRWERLTGPHFHSKESLLAQNSPLVRSSLRQLLKDSAQNFETGFSYAQLRHFSTDAAAAKAAGKLQYGRFSIGLSERHIIQTVLAVLAASTLGWFTSGPHFFWAALGAFSVLIGTTTTSSRMRKTFYRVGGTAAGAAGGMLVTWLTGPNLPLLNLILAATSAAIAFTLVKRNYTLFSIFLTATVMQIYLLTAAPLYGYAFGRILDNAVGAILAWVISALVFPLHTSDVIRVLLSTLEKAITTVLTGFQQILQGNTDSIRPLLDARQVDNAAHDLTSLARFVLGTRMGTSNVWVRRVASRVPAVSSAVADLAHLAEAGRSYPQQYLHKNMSVYLAELSLLIDQVATVVAQLGQVHAPSDQKYLIGQIGDFVYQAEKLRLKIKAALKREDSEPPLTSQQYEWLNQTIEVLIRLNEAVRNLTRKAWGS